MAQRQYGYFDERGVFVASQGRQQYNGGYNNSGNYNNNRNQGQPQKKHSGCRKGQDKKGNPYLIGWNASKTRGMISFIASPYSGTKEIKSKSGKTWQNWFVKITFKATGDIKNYSGMYNVSNNKLYIKDLNLVANPGAPNGGYFGKHISKRYNRR